jgi:hypothetical protein
MDYHLLQPVEANQQATEQLLKALLHKGFLPSQRQYRQVK